MINAFYPMVMAAALGIGAYVMPGGDDPIIPARTVPKASSSAADSLNRQDVVIVPLAAETPSDFDSAHVEWCLERYRSYNPRDNTWVSYSGRVRECDSPFW